MARLRDHSLVGLVFSSSVALACSAPPGAEDNGDSVPDYLGPLPGEQLPGGVNPGVNTGSTNNGVNPPSSETVGNNGNVPIDNSNNGIAGSSMQPNGTGGTEAGQGQGGSGNMPPGNNNPPPNNAPPVGAGCGAGVIFCENFDGIALGPITTTVNGMRPDRTVSIVEEAGRGRVLQVTAGRTYGNKSGVYLDNFQAPNNSHFGRAFIRVAQFPVTGGDHWVIVEATLNENGERVRPVGGQFQKWAPGSAGPSGDWTDHDVSDAVATAGLWDCVEWQINGANGANDIALWVNGTEVLPLDHANFNLPAFNLLWIGWVVYQDGGQPPTYDVRFDDVVLSSERIGCN